MLGAIGEGPRPRNENQRRKKLNTTDDVCCIACSHMSNRIPPSESANKEALLPNFINEKIGSWRTRESMFS